MDRSRDGASFTNRRVVAIQHGQPIFNMAASFQIEEEGPDHQVPVPEVAPPEQLPDLTAEVRKHLESMPAERAAFLVAERPFEFRSVEAIEAGEPRPGVRHLWFRLVDRCPDDPVMHQCLLAYMSDYHLLETATLPHGLAYRTARRHAREH